MAGLLNNLPIALIDFPASGPAPIEPVLRREKSLKLYAVPHPSEGQKFCWSDFGHLQHLILSWPEPDWNCKTTKLLSKLLHEAFFDHRLAVIVVCPFALSAADHQRILRLGALSVFELRSQDLAREVKLLAQHILAVSQVRLVKRKPQTKTSQPLPVQSYRALGVVSSTGGPAALVRLFQNLKSPMPVPIFLVQHIGPEFSHGFSDWLAGQLPFPVKIAAHQEQALPNTIYLAPPQYHMRYDGQCILLCDEPPISFNKPSGTVLFRSLAASLGASAIGVILTGMGDDGAKGLKEMREAGAYTMAQDQASSVIFGMPAAAKNLNAVLEDLPVAEIAARINQLLRI